jgi:aryl-alcohol dehydrogenase-like predicted oxidoreductase
MVIATKFGIVREAGKYERTIDNRPAYIRASCEASLQRLGVDAIDLYYCHRRNPEVPIADTVGAMADLVKAGKVRQIGLSEVSAKTLRTASAVHPVAALQSEYSLWTRGPEDEMLKVCAELGTTFVAYSPLGRAFLTGTVDAESLADNDFRKRNPRFTGDAGAANRRLVDALHDYAAARGLSNAQIALAWLLNKHPHVVPIPGTRRIHYLEQNVAATDCRLSASEIAELDTLFTPEKISGPRYPKAGLLGIE